ncbi:MAG: outer membrane protein transport protein, partial [Hyphomicrobium sp.]
GLSAFNNAFSTAAVGSVSNNGHEVVLGAGLRGGLEWAITPTMRLGVAGSTRIYSQRFDDYKGLFAEQGDFDIPANMQAGIAVDLSPALTLMLDYKRIWYSDVEATGNPATNIFRPDGSGRFGSSGNFAAGFGWKDMNIFKLGMEFRANSDLTLRAGYSYNNQVLQSRDVMLNVLAPAVSQHHITGGFMYRMSPNMDLEFAAMYSPREHVVGGELGNGIGNANHIVDISMAQYEATIGIKYRFDSPAPLK